MASIVDGEIASTASGARHPPADSGSGGTLPRPGPQAGLTTLYRAFSMESLHNPKNVQHLISMLQRPDIDPDQKDQNNDAPIHVYVKSKRADKVDLIVTLLTHSKANVNLEAARKSTALHFAVKVGDIACVKALIAFGADINALNVHNQTLLDVATSMWVHLQRRRKVFPATSCDEPTADSLAVTSVCDPKMNAPRLPVDIPCAAQGAHDQCQSPQLGRPRSFSTLSSRPHESSPRESQPSTNGTNDPPLAVRTGKPNFFTQSSIDDSRDFLESMTIRTLSSDRDVELAVPHSPTSTTPGPLDDLLQLLYSVGAQQGDSKRLRQIKKIPKLLTGAESDDYEGLLHSIKIGDYMEGRTPLSLCEQLNEHINTILNSEKSLSCSIDEAIAISLQQKDIHNYQKTKKDDSIAFSMRGGSRILVLDGGGMKGLVEVEVLAQLEEYTGKKVTELFDWIIGTSTGGIVALALVYAQMPLSKIRQFYFKLKDLVFGNPRGGVHFNTEAFQHQLQKTFGTEVCMNDVTSPKVLIAAVNKRVNPLQLHFFNNCFSNEFSTQPVWKVARYTSATPVLFNEFENYVDGGVLANNPSNYGLTAIQKFYCKQNEKLPISMVVSLGTGVFPDECVGETNIEEFLTFGAHWLKMNTLVRKAKSLINLLSNALVESEFVAEDCRGRCREQGIPFFRFSPHLDETIAAGEVDTEKLITMIVSTKQQTWDQGMPELLQLFMLVAEANRKKKFIEKRRNKRTHAEPEPEELT